LFTSPQIALFGCSNNEHQELAFARNTSTSALSRQQQTTSVKYNLHRHKREQYIHAWLTGFLTYLLAFGKKIMHTER
jgi:hypothetical protein